MIRLFTILYKTDFNHVPSGIELFRVVAPQFKPGLTQCPPPCKTRGQMGRHAKYNRNLVDYDGGVKEYIVEIERAKCAPCGRTHAALPDVIVPYKTYCIIFILIVLKEYFHTRAATSICKKYGIAVSTLYKWRDRYLKHTSLDLGAIVEAAILSKSPWLEDLQNIFRASATHDFFQRFGFSFLQHKKTTRYSSA